jgi:2-polyprenyl-3-methyl-5-hydroxy-6-metoxy-1,4-benzoquinol methylase
MDAPETNKAQAHQPGYRERIYGHYATQFINAELFFDARKARRWGRAYDFYLRRWLPERKEAVIADVACGDGKLLYFFKQRGFGCVTGVDVSPEQAQLARQVVPEVSESDLLVFLEERPGRFDLITGLDIVEHFRKDEVLPFLEACRDALKPGGRLILQTPNAESPWGGALRYGDFTHEVCFTPAGLAHLLALCGFQKIETREMGPAPRGITSALRFAAWQIIKRGLSLWNLIETGRAGSGIHSRVFGIAGIKL